MPASLSPGMPNMIQDTRVKFECQTNNTWYEHPLYNSWLFFLGQLGPGFKTASWASCCLPITEHWN